MLTNDHHLLSYILPERNNRIHNLRLRRRELILTKGDVRNFFYKTVIQRCLLTISCVYYVAVMHIVSQFMYMYFSRCTVVLCQPLFTH